MYDTVAAFLDDPDTGVREEAIAFLDSRTDPLRRRWASEAFRELG
jgi:hypothetical protein